MRILFLSFLVLVFSYTPSFAQEMSVKEAYQTLRHQQTTFKRSIASMSERESKYLEHLFFVTDMAFRERMVMLQYFGKRKDGDYIHKYNDQIGELMAGLALVQPPNSRLAQVTKLIKEAITEQKTFYNEWHNARGSARYDALHKNYTSHRLVQSSHGKLIQAYNVLRQTYPREAQHNTQSFFDHLCALDFI